MKELMSIKRMKGPNYIPKCQKAIRPRHKGLIKIHGACCKISSQL